MATINADYNKLAAGYLFPEISRRVGVYQKEHPGVKIFRLGIGNTTEPLTPTIIEGLKLGVAKLADVKTYSGYGDEQGDSRLRAALAQHYAKRNIQLDPKEIFISDGAKCDAANVQQIFGKDNIVAVQDPAYPVYIDTNVAAGRTGDFDPLQNTYGKVIYMPCTKNSLFTPEVPDFKVDLIYLCSPNNPTGAVMPARDLQKFVDYARKNKAIIIFDAAYSEFISDPWVPRSIYEMDGAKECAIEVQSFSKSAGFTGVRLGWTVVPHNLVTESPIILNEKGEPTNNLNALWNRRSTTYFNGASNIVQEGGLAVLTEQGQAECGQLVNYYMNNARIIRESMKKKGFEVHGGINAPFLWMKTPADMKSWEFFDKMLREAQVVCTPGAGFGPSGEGYVRLSAFGHTENIEGAVRSIQENLVL